jgi:MinD-like ATPase involved in chromosome partitioning or flagellar assembly
LNIPRNRVLLVLNNPEGFSEFNVENVAANLRSPISVQIPNDPKTVIRSINHAEPLVISRRDSKISERIEELAASLVTSLPGQRAA